MSLPDIASQFSVDVNGLNALRRQVRNNSPQALKAVAQQFEAMFLQIVLKSMRDAMPKDGIFDTEQTRMYQSLLDQQWAQVLAAKGGTGLAAEIERQLAQTNQEPVPMANLPLGRPARAFPLSTAPAPMPLPQNAASASARRDFVSQILPHALSVSRATGIPASFMVAQAALETGWGKSQPRTIDGRPSYNLFGIKAGKSWNGPVAEASSDEYVDGVLQKQVERFRAYGSYAQAFDDYANLLLSNPRYANVLGSQNPLSFARSLQQAGYASDPGYAAKLAQIIGSPRLQEDLQG